jgi:hypothetical protein
MDDRQERAKKRLAPLVHNKCNFCKEKYTIPSWKKCDKDLCIKLRDRIRKAEKYGKVLSKNGQLINK